ncbi:MAG: hypothetical protein ACTS80_00890 [Candidatus Hodgkinia cicadicola]
MRFPFKPPSGGNLRTFISLRFRGPSADEWPLTFRRLTFHLRLPRFNSLTSNDLMNANARSFIKPRTAKYTFTSEWAGNHVMLTRSKWGLQLRGSKLVSSKLRCPRRNNLPN